ncbi:hypothetical protein C5Y96_18185 [Blastopirellula marina]|uniref:Type II toxin-antitoxin system ParD family antitoxin n=1 Tax=Blastopirellula marina TaxID=124 RepID=A0A2S8F5M3_9BACT|nr:MULTISPECIES: hypothetical protein [Pirellulaceae]PQO27465.1 hypothetical protein C5Y96_18185 [Blastopirellula marina]RCS48002.1 hypothetical protein DTL36_18210 [Bremerella cremea]
MNIHISGVAEEVIQSIIDAGDAATPEEAVALLAQRAMSEREMLPATNDPQVIAAISVGIESGEAGPLTKEDWNSLHTKLDQYLAEKQGQRSAG